MVIIDKYEMVKLSQFLQYVIKHGVVSELSFEITEGKLLPTEESIEKISKIIGITIAQTERGLVYSARNSFGRGSYTYAGRQSPDTRKAVMCVVASLFRLENRYTT